MFPALIVVQLLLLVSADSIVALRQKASSALDLEINQPQPGAIPNQTESNTSTRLDLEVKGTVTNRTKPNRTKRNTPTEQQEQQQQQQHFNDTLGKHEQSSTKKKTNWAVLMVSINETYAELSTSMTKKYADIHGYDFIVRTSFDPEIVQDKKKRYWQKLITINDALAEGYPFVYWKDTDVIITDCHKSLDKLFQEEKEAKAERWRQANATRSQQKIDVLFTGDTHGILCTGNMWIRNTPWSRDFFSRALDILKTGKPGPWHDQSSVQYLLLGMPKKCSESLKWCMPKRLSCFEGGYDCEKLFSAEYRDHVAVGNSATLSAFWQARMLQPKRMEDMFSIHAGGMPSKDQKLELMRKFATELSTCNKV